MERGNFLQSIWNLFNHSLTSLLSTVGQNSNLACGWGGGGRPDEGSWITSLSLLSPSDLLCLRSPRSKYSASIFFIKTFEHFNLKSFLSLMTHIPDARFHSLSFIIVLLFLIFICLLLHVHSHTLFSTVLISLLFHVHSHTLFSTFL